MRGVRWQARGWEEGDSDAWYATGTDVRERGRDWRVQVPDGGDLLSDVSKQQMKRRKQKDDTMTEIS